MCRVFCCASQIAAEMIVVREGREEDLPVLHEFNMKLAKETEDTELDGALVDRGLRAVLADPTKGQYFVAEADGDDDGKREIVGCVAVTFEWSDWRYGMVWWLQNVYVKETHRKRGVFRLMFDSIMKRVNADPSIKGLRLYTNCENAVAHKTYEALGMNGDHYKVYEIMK